MKKDKFIIATIQVSPLFMDLDATIEKACDLIKRLQKKVLK
ncbi:MAG: hypothetical protein OQK45_04750 [Sulfurovum sp.]|nr:hypothetical protein [Sulfurovum sp.]